MNFFPTFLAITHTSRPPAAGTSGFPGGPAAAAATAAAVPTRKMLFRSSTTFHIQSRPLPVIILQAVEKHPQGRVAPVKLCLRVLYHGQICLIVMLKRGAENRFHWNVLVFMHSQNRSVHGTHSFCKENSGIWAPCTKRGSLHESNTCNLFNSPRNNKHVRSTPERGTRRFASFFNSLTTTPHKMDSPVGNPAPVVINYTGLLLHGMVNTPARCGHGK